jgi:hypothetical protein
MNIARRQRRPGTIVWSMEEDVLEVTEATQTSNMHETSCGATLAGRHVPEQRLSAGHLGKPYPLHHHNHPDCD